MNRLLRLLTACSLSAGLAVFAAPGASAHESSAGDIVVGHAFATPTVPGATVGAAYFANLQNKGKTADKLLRASTPAAARVETHTMSVDAQGVMRMREIDGIAVGAQEQIRMKPGAGMHLMLIGLREPLKDGTSFPMTLEFERAGKIEVKVVVQAPKAGAPAEAHMH